MTNCPHYLMIFFNCEKKLVDVLSRFLLRTYNMGPYGETRRVQFLLVGTVCSKTVASLLLPLSMLQDQFA